MLKNENIICISWLLWDSIPLVMHHMMRRLSKYNRVLFVDPPIAYSNLVIRPSMSKGHFEKTVKWFHGVRRIDENFYVYYPPPLMLQYGHSEKIDRISQAYTGKAISKAAQRLGFTEPILWIYHPYAIRPRGQFHEKLVCYDCNDDVSFFFCLNFDKKKRLSELERDLAVNADIIFATSKYLYGLRKTQNHNTYYLPSALDVALFSQALSPELNVAQEIKGLSGRIIGFIGGMVNSKMNWQWIRAAAVSRPGWNFVFVGPCAEPPPHYILEQRNITFFGPRPQDFLPAFIKGFDVCIIPYQGEDFLKACQPTKAFEYLAAGKPVVSVRIPELDEYKNVIHMCDNADEFIGNIESALEYEDTEEIIRRREQIVQGWSWEYRVEKASQIIADLMKANG